MEQSVSCGWFCSVFVIKKLMTTPTLPVQWDACWVLHEALVECIAAIHLNSFHQRTHAIDHRYESTNHQLIKLKDNYNLHTTTHRRLCHSSISSSPDEPKNRPIHNS
jgi:hypothetical protein